MSVPIFHSKPSWQYCHALSILRQIGEWFVFVDIFRYLLINILAQRLCGNWKTRHDRLASKALFFWRWRWMPNPPISRGVAIFFHFKRCIFFFVVVVPQRKLRWYCSILCMMVVGMWMYCMTWLSKLLKVDLIRVVRPTIVRKFVFHPASLDLKLSNKNWKSLFFGRDWKIGNPKYFSKDVSSLIWKESITKFRASVGQFFEKNNFDFAKLIFCPE